jgi:BlaI family penicillinase repressor
MERISEAELEIMQVLWDTDAPLTVTEVAERVDPKRSWSHSTVKTMLSRLEAKGALRHEEEGRRFVYTPVVPRDQYARKESRRLVDSLFGGRAAPLVAQLAEGDGLSKEDVAELETLLKGIKA